MRKRKGKESLGEAEDLQLWFGLVTFLPKGFLNSGLLCLGVGPRSLRELPPMTSWGNRWRSVAFVPPCLSHVVDVRLSPTLSLFRRWGHSRAGGGGSGT